MGPPSPNDCNTGTHFTKAYDLIVGILWKLFSPNLYSINQIIAQFCICHAELPWHVPNCNLIRSLIKILTAPLILTSLEYVVTSLCERGSWCYTQCSVLLPYYCVWTLRNQANGVVMQCACHVWLYSGHWIKQITHIQASILNNVS